MKIVLSVGLLVVLPVIADAQPPRVAAVARTAWGDPDLQGVWDYRTITPLERPDEFGGREVLTSEEAVELESEATVRATVERPQRPGSVGSYNRFWVDYGTNVVESGRTSLIVDPPDGKLPSLNPDVPQQSGGLPAERPIRYRTGGVGTDGPEDRGLFERCILGNNAGPPLLPHAYNNNIQLLQTPGHVVIVHEMIHDARIIPLDGRPHLPASIRLWMGDSRAHWDGDTLIVETTNFTEKVSYLSNIGTSLGTGETFHLTERFRRDDDENLHYEYTVNDPVTFTQPFTVVLPMRKLEGRIYEYACHEGNYGLYNQLSGARVQDKAAAQDTRTAPR